MERSRTLTAQNHNLAITSKNTISEDYFSCFGDCVTNIGYLDWIPFYSQSLGGLSAGYASSTTVGVLLGSSTTIGVLSGCHNGCLASWLWFDVFDF